MTPKSDASVGVSPRTTWKTRTTNLSDLGLGNSVYTSYTFDAPRRSQRLVRGRAGEPALRPIAKLRGRPGVGVRARNQPERFVAATEHQAYAGSCDGSVRTAVKPSARR